MTTIAGASTATKWVNEVTQGHDYFMTIDAVQTNTTGATKFLSLAPNTADPKRDLDVVEWSVSCSPLATNHTPSCT